jgi:tetratricopeptide (TPR) repeat protein
LSFRYRKTINLGGGIRLNLSKTGVGISAGVPGARYSVHSSGRSVRTVGLLGTGMYFRKDTYSRLGAKRSSAKPTLSAPTVAMYPKAGFLAPKEDKLFVQGITAYMQGQLQQALGLLQDVATRDAAGRHVSEEFFLALCLIGLGRTADAIAPLETVIASDQSLPDAIMTKYKVSGTIEVAITPFSTVGLPMSSLGAALLLAEAYQHTGTVEKAIDLLESLGSIAGNEVFAVSLSDLYADAKRWDDVIRVTEGFNANTDDLMAELLVYRAMALEEMGMFDAALQVLKEALRFRKRNRLILRLAHYVRGRAYEGAGKKAQAKKEYERVFAEDAGFGDVRERLGVDVLAPAQPDAST